MPDGLPGVLSAPLLFVAGLPVEGARTRQPDIPSCQNLLHSKALEYILETLNRETDFSANSEASAPITVSAIRRKCSSCGASAVYCSACLNGVPPPVIASKATAWNIFLVT
jgi:hypothetical protein